MVKNVPCTIFHIICNNFYNLRNHDILALHYRFAELEISTPKNIIA